jgi:hypothetical protein
VLTPELWRPLGGTANIVMRSVALANGARAGPRVCVRPRRHGLSLRARARARGAADVTRVCAGCTADPAVPAEAVLDFGGAVDSIMVGKHGKLTLTNLTLRNPAPRLPVHTASHARFLLDGFGPYPSITVLPNATVRPRPGARTAQTARARWTTASDRRSLEAAAGQGPSGRRGEARGSARARAARRGARWRSARRARRRWSSTTRASTSTPSRPRARLS